MAPSCFQFANQLVDLGQEPIRDRRVHQHVSIEIQLQPSFAAQEVA
jgi:hypothetical protein